MDSSEVRRHFTALIERPHGEFRLAEGALLIAQEEYLESRRASVSASP